MLKLNLMLRSADVARLCPLQVADLSRTLWSLKQHVEVLESNLLSNLAISPTHA
jgi:hypothetical protein